MQYRRHCLVTLHGWTNTQLAMKLLAKVDTRMTCVGAQTVSSTAPHSRVRITATDTVRDDIRNGHITGVQCRLQQQ